jgi:ketosteroid isomerase-like protein
MSLELPTVLRALALLAGVGLAAALPALSQSAQNPRPTPPPAREQAEQKTPPEPAPPESPAPYLDEVYRNFARAYRDLDADAVARLYSEDALYLPAGSERPIVRGRAGIRELFEQLFAVNRDVGATLAIEFRIVERRVEGPMAADVGYYRLTRTPSAEMMEAEEDGIRVSVGKFVVVAEKTPPQTAGGTPTWRFRTDAFSGAPEEAFDEATGRVIGATARKAQPAAPQTPEGRSNQ